MWEAKHHRYLLLQVTKSSPWMHLNGYECTFSSGQCISCTLIYFSLKWNICSFAFLLLTLLISECSSPHLNFTHCTLSLFPLLSPSMFQFPKAKAMKQIITNTPNTLPYWHHKQHSSPPSVHSEPAMMKEKKTKITSSAYSDKWGHISSKQAVVVTLLQAIHPITKIDLCFICVWVRRCFPISPHFRMPDSLKAEDIT